MLYDKDIRDELFEYLEDTYGKVRIIEEKTMGKSRADVVMITKDSMWGIEIKSDADTYVRLERQVKDYNRFFDYNIVVVGSTHGQSVSDHVPEYWGIISVEENSGKLDFYIIREPKPNPKREKAVKFRNQLCMLWRPELAHILEKNNLPKYAYLSKLNLVKKLMEKLPEEILKMQMCEEFMERDYNTIAVEIAAYKAKVKNKTKK